MCYVNFMPGSRKKQMKQNKQQNKKEKTDQELEQAERDFNSLFEPGNLCEL